MNKAVVQVPAFKEPNVEQTLDQIADQGVPAGWTVEYEAWVTLDAEDNETWLQANAHPDFTAYEAPPGKISARNAAHGHAFNGDAHSVVTWDADSIPAHDGVLAAILEPLERDGVIASNGNPRKPYTNPVNVAASFLGTVEDYVRPHMNGQLHAFHRGAWVCAGPFRTDLDQRHMNAVRTEEEFRFHQRLRSCGEVVKAKDAVVVEDPRRVAHHLKRPFQRFGRYPQTEWEKERGAKTFMPRDRE